MASEKGKAGGEVAMTTTTTAVNVEEVEKGGVFMAEDNGGGGLLRTAETLLRVTPMGLCIAALVVMLRNRQSNDYGSISYSDLTGFEYLVFANGVCLAYSLVSAFYTAKPRPPSISRAWGLYLLDQALAYIVLTAAAASAEILFLAYKGDQEVTWSEACSTFGGFCKTAKASVGITFGTVVCYIGLSLVSSFRLFSSYDAPIPFLVKGSGVAAFPG